MEIFEPYEIEIKTGRTKNELITRFRKRAKIEGDKFYIDSDPYGIIASSNVIGDISDKSEWTVVSFKIYASPFLKAVSYSWLGGVGIGLLAFAIKALIRWQYDPGILWGIGFWIVGFIFAQISFRTSVDMQEESIRQMIRSNE